MQHAEPVVRSVPELGDAAQGRAARRDLAHERRREPGRDDAIARRVPGVVGQPRRLVVPAHAVRAAVVRVVLGRLNDTRIRRDRRRPDGEAKLVVQQEHVARRVRARVLREWADEQPERQHRTSERRCGHAANGIPPHRPF